MRTHTYKQMMLLQQYVLSILLLRIHFTETWAPLCMPVIGANLTQDFYVTIFPNM